MMITAFALAISACLIPKWSVVTVCFLTQSQLFLQVCALSGCLLGAAVSAALDADYPSCW